MRSALFIGIALAVWGCGEGPGDGASGGDGFGSGAPSGGAGGSGAIPGAGTDAGFGLPDGMGVGLGNGIDSGVGVDGPGGRGPGCDADAPLTFEIGAFVQAFVPAEDGEVLTIRTGSEGGVSLGFDLAGSGPIEVITHLQTLVENDGFIVASGVVENVPFGCHPSDYRVASDNAVAFDGDWRLAELEGLEVILVVTAQYMATDGSMAEVVDRVRGTLQLGVE